jgi:hypothetical protein
MIFKALFAAKTGKAISTSVVEMNEQDLMPGDVSIAVDYSTVNYKDALAITGRGNIIRQFPLIAGIDFAGIDSVNAPQEARVQAWSRLARDLDLNKLARMTQVVGLAEVPAVVGQMFEGLVRGRTVVDVNA